MWLRQPKRLIYYLKMPKNAKMNNILVVNKNQVIRTQSTLS